LDANLKWNRLLEEYFKKYYEVKAFTWMVRQSPNWKVLCHWLQKSVSRFPFHQVYQSTAVSLASQGINFPVNQTFALLHNLQKIFNTDPIRQFSTPIISLFLNYQVARFK
jgi:hypothetical protein